MLYGRQEERAIIAGLLAGARRGRSGVLVIRGEAGVGKRTLLQDAAEQAEEFLLLRGAGVEAEFELTFAALRRLLRPVLDRLDRLPGPQADALRAALGLADTRPNRFLVELAVLGLLSMVAAEQPLLCLVSDAQWLDRASADALVFTARRLETEPIVLLLAAGDDSPRQLNAPDLPDLHLTGLDPEAAAQLLEARAGKLTTTVRDRLIEETGGNPLALEELPATLTSGQLSGREPLPERLPLGARLQHAFLQQAQRLPAQARTLLLVAAAEDTGELATVLAAGRLLGADPEALEPAERAGLVQVVDSALVFRHPLVRSAVYQGATFGRRQAVHQALIKVLDAKGKADRRAWHLAAATPGPNEEVARALEASADPALRRGGPLAAAAALERAAALTPGPGPRARRLVAAAECCWEGGQPDRAQTLLDQVQPSPADPVVRARLAHVRGRVELAAGTPATACTLLIEGAQPILDSDPGQAIEMLVLATWAALAAGELDRIVDQIDPAVPRRPGQHDIRVQRVAESLLAVGLHANAQADAGRQVSPAPGETATTWPPPLATWGWPMLVVPQPAADGVAAHEQYARSVAATRASGRVSALTLALANLAIVDFSLGRWPDAVDNATEGLRLATQTGQDATACYFQALLASIALLQGRVDDFRSLADQALTAAIPRRLAVVTAAVSWNQARLDLAEGRPEAALERLRALHLPQHPTAHPAIALLATRELVETAARADRLEGMEPYVARLEQWASWDRRTFTSLVARRSRALISRGEEAERHYQAALATDGIGELPFELARTELAYGEWLRRARRRADARPHLRTALGIFRQLGATPWAEQARAELRASGETAGRGEPGTRGQLTPQERQIAGLVGQGLTNQQIGDQLFLSAHTVGYHLHKIYAKLGIATRAELGVLDLADGDTSP
jgi:DNA-binding CsgD family transcriptional regulator